VTCSNLGMVVGIRDSGARGRRTGAGKGDHFELKLRAEAQSQHVTRGSHDRRTAGFLAVTTNAKGTARGGISRAQTERIVLCQKAGSGCLEGRKTRESMEERGVY
jgi:hypothetical protein